MATTSQSQLQPMEPNAKLSQSVQAHNKPLSVALKNMESLSVELKTSRVRVNRALSEFSSKGRLLNGLDCYTWVLRRKHLVGWTYNFNRLCTLWQRFDRLISCQGVPSHRIRIANNTHMKCYIDRKSMLVTSFNLTHATVNDLGIEVTDVTLCNYMRRLFNKHWKELE